MDSRTLKTILDGLSAQGCQVESVWPDGFYLPWWTLARVEVVASADDGAVFVSFWSIGYQDDPRGVHTHKVVRWSSDDPAMEVELIDDRGRLWRMMALVPGQDVDALHAWEAQQASAAAHADRMAVIDASARAMQLEKVATWGD